MQLAEKSAVKQMKPVRKRLTQKRNINPLLWWTKTSVGRISLQKYLHFNNIVISQINVTKL